MAVVNCGEADDEIAGGFLCLIEFAGMHEIDRGVGRFGQLVWFIITVLESRTSGCHLRLELGLLGSGHGGLCSEDSTRTGKYTTRWRCTQKNCHSQC